MATKATISCDVCGVDIADADSRSNFRVKLTPQQIERAVTEMSHHIATVLEAMAGGSNAIAAKFQYQMLDVCPVCVERLGVRDAADKLLDALLAEMRATRTCGCPAETPHAMAASPVH